ncbi:MAG TPA: pentapeptide repeat-containing protein [Saprospiraceae bacterium]|nr:pentapeptide repeat-containing protein [Saprospiraceae bacterium]
MKKSFNLKSRLLVFVFCCLGSSSLFSQGCNEEKDDNVRYECWEKVLRSRAVIITNADLRGMVIQDIDFSNRTFVGGNVDGTRFINCNFEGVRFMKKGLRNVYFENCNFKGAAYFSPENCEFVNVDLKEYNVIQAKKNGNNKFTEKDCEGEVNKQDCWERIIKLGQKNMQGKDLTHLDLQGLDLSNVDLRNADLSYSNLSSTNLKNANLTNAKLDHTYFEKADLTNAKMISCQASGSFFNSANLKNADINKANFELADFKNTDFLDAKGAKTANFDHSNIHEAKNLTH